MKGNLKQCSRHVDCITSGTTCVGGVGGQSELAIPPSERSNALRGASSIAPSEAERWANFK